MADENLKEAFLHPADNRRPMYYFELPAIDDETLSEQLMNAVQTCRRSGCSTIIPQLPLGTELDAAGIARVCDIFAELLSFAKKEGLKVGFYLDPAFEHAVIREMSSIGNNDMRAKILECKEYICSRNEKVSRPLHHEMPLSVVAYAEETCEIIDLRPFVRDGKIQWNAPDGNWVVREYFAAEDTEREGANYLSYDASYRYLSAVFTLFQPVFVPYLGTTLTVLAYSGIGFNGKNRRSWDPSFNELFEKRFGFDPAPVYPALFGYIGKKTDHIKTLLMTVRASMIQHGIMHALRDFAVEHGLKPFGNLSEPKLTACSWLVGDAMLNNIYSPCALLDKAYMYGVNSVKIAAGAAYNFDEERVNAELFRNYGGCSSGSLWNDAMNAFARGVNCAAFHLTDALTGDATFGDFAARVQTLLRGGRHVSDIAMLYPIYHLHSKVNLYFSPTHGYEYPVTPPTADYMTLINSISIYSGHDLTVLHPEVLNARCYAEDGVLYLKNAHNYERFRVVVLPSTDMISLENLKILKTFFDGGGKILATGALPTKAFEYDETGENDRMVQRLTEEIFGRDACDRHVMKDYCHHKNEAGGESFFLYFNFSATDGTQMTKSSTVNEALNSFDIPFDVYLPGMLRLECTGGLNSAYPEFSTIGLHLSFPGGGMMGHIHKHRGDADIYYFANTTKMEYNHHVLLRGAFDVEERNPYTGDCHERHRKFFRYKGEIYTNLRLTLHPSESVFFYATKAPLSDEEIAATEEITSIDHLRGEHAALMSEF